MKKHELKKIIKETILNEMGEAIFNEAEAQPTAPANFTEEDLRVVEKYAKKLQEVQRLWARFTNSNLSIAASKVLRNVPQGNNQTMWSSNLRSTNTSLFNLSTASNELVAEIRNIVSPSSSPVPATREPDVSRLTKQPSARTARPAAPVAPARPAAPSRPVTAPPTGRE
jgi:hypothetical protein